MALRDNLIKFIASFAYIGYLPFIPGTFGSLAGVVLFYLLKDNPCALILFTLGLTILGFFICAPAEKAMGKTDARPIVIDEVCGMLLSLLFLPYDIKLVAIGFFIFRLLDSLKPFPAGRFEKIGAGVGIMLDDIVAGVYTNIILQLALRLGALKGS